ncbi:glycosyltransferase family 39 protein [Yinghuangia seranimata]|uniref:glycosyltransferase family 39 protein n=1 Tax=Yinghuangia seranimata TaxID=408067 RepID=UPI00248CF19A|nr:glycosyltransferase family 39 protein [Yinghuangia seranimata]MDI2129767.1 glycosyltransferase family 39 protein [Yinghuangia seranimata]
MGTAVAGAARQVADRVGAASPRRRSRALMPVGCGLVTLLLCLFRITHPVLWRDELATWTAARRDTSELVRMLGDIDASSGAYYLFMHAWTAVFGDSVLALRLPSALAMAGTAACVAVLARRSFGPAAGGAAGLVFALIPAVSRYGQEARAYAFVCLTAAVATLLLLRAIDAGPRLRPWSWYAAAVALTGGWHLVALAVLVGHAAFALQRRSARGPFLLAVAAGLVPLVPLFALGASQRAAQIEWIPAPDTDMVQGMLPRVVASGPATAALLVLAIGACTGPARRTVACWWAAAVLPTTAVLLVSILGDQSYFLARYLLFTLPAWAVLAGQGAALLAARLTRRTTHRRVVVAAVVLALAACGLPDQRTLRGVGAHERRSYPDPSLGTWLDYAAAADVIRADLRPGDGIAYSAAGQRIWHVDGGIEYYLGDDHRPDDVLRAASGPDRDTLWSVDCPDPDACLDRAAAPRIWLVAVNLTRQPDNPYRGIRTDTANALRARYHVVTSTPVHGLTVSLLVPGATPPAPEPCTSAPQLTWSGSEFLSDCP